MENIRNGSHCFFVVLQSKVGATIRSEQDNQSLKTEFSFWYGFFLDWSRTEIKFSLSLLYDFDSCVEERTIWGQTEKFVTPVLQYSPRCCRNPIQHGTSGREGEI